MYLAYIKDLKNQVTMVRTRVEVRIQPRLQALSVMQKVLQFDSVAL